jgi:two-component system sensor histidine kinase KdpD
MRLEVDLASELPSHHLDPLLVDRIMTNLLRNALEYAEQGPVRVKAWGYEGNTFVTVEDEGPGVPPEFHELIFRRWHRGTYDQHIAGKGDNLGLGLYFVRMWMELHGGRVEYDTTYHNGARFILCFPKGRESDSQSNTDD